MREADLKLHKSNRIKPVALGSGYNRAKVALLQELCQATGCVPTALLRLRANRFTVGAQLLGEGQTKALCGMGIHAHEL